MRAFLTVAIIHLLAVMSPGPDFAIVVKQSVTQPRRIAISTALGVGLGMFVHVAYSLLGIGLLIAQSILLFSIIKLIGAGYLLFIGWSALTAKPSHDVLGVHSSVPVMSSAKALRVGFLCNALNPKATLFFLALFTQVIDPHTPLLIQLCYGIYMAVATFVWFAMLGSVLSADIIRRHINVFHIWIERCMGAVLIVLGLKVALAARE
jgi:threonine/homoserine/homoserine lactone efflux protein